MSQNIHNEIYYTHVIIFGMLYVYDVFEGIEIIVYPSYMTQLFKKKMYDLYEKNP